MADNDQITPNNQNQQVASHASFVLRCWSVESGDMRTSLVDVRTGNAYPLADLIQVPELLSHLIAPLTAQNSPGED